MKKTSLRRQLVLPFVLLVLFVSSAIGWVSFRAGEHAVGELTERILADNADRIRVATEQHLAGALTVLQAVDPDPSTVPRVQPFSDDLAQLETRLWSASGLFMLVNNYVYFGGADGRFVGVNRMDKDFVELYLRRPGDPVRTVFRADGPGVHDEVLRTDDYDPRRRPWYRAALQARGPAWSPVYNDFTSKEPTITLARAVHGPGGTLAGVLATDVTLATLSDFLRGLAVSRNGVAFLIDADGYMIATSGKDKPYRLQDGAAVRVRAADMPQPAIREAWAHLRAWRAEGAGRAGTLAREVVAADGEILEMGVVRVGRPHGIDWTAVVVIPRSDFMGDVTRSLHQAIAIGVVCVLLALVVGILLLDRVTRDLRRLTDAAEQVGNGEPLPPLNIRRRDEIGQLARTFSEMEHNLRVDKLTGVFNRESLHAQIAFLQRQAAQLQQDGGDWQAVRFALLFVDLDRFKSINDHFGHAAGDHALVTVAARLKAAVRSTDVVARYGGDEFVILLKGTSGEEAVLEACGKIRDAAEQPIAFENAILGVGVSIGWAVFPDDGIEPKRLLKVADSRMFDTKRERRAAR